MDYYKVLEISPNANMEDIKKAYRKKAIELHPDKNPGKDIEFGIITKAYEILGNEKKRKEYDFSREPPRISKQSSSKGSDLKIGIKIKTEDLARHSTKMVKIIRKGLCHNCGGTGSKSKKNETCSGCNGSGLEKISLVLGIKKLCKNCDGAGNTPQRPLCDECSGTGLIQETINRNIQLSPFSTGCIVLPGAGNCKRGGEAGDLYVELMIKEDPVYKIQGLNVYRKLIISPARATIGDKIDLDVFGRTVKIKIPPGTQYGNLIELENEGLSHGSRKGSLRIRILLEIPNKISEKEEDLYKELLKIERKIPCQRVWKI